MRCPICETVDQWENVDQYRVKPENMSICRSCGFVTYPDLYKKKEEVLEYYKEEYRRAPTMSNIYSAEAKSLYHAQFLKDLIKEWREAGRKDLVVTDIGSAFGAFLFWFKKMLPCSDVVGVELTRSFIANALYQYGIESIPEFDKSKKYDFIASYKSLEHIFDPDIELKSYIDALKDDGVLYLSVPMWFGMLKDFGRSGIDLEYYYHTNHVNVWNRAHVEYLIAKFGGEIVKENHLMYDSTYLIKRKSHPLVKVDVPKLYDRTITCLKAIKTAWDFYSLPRCKADNFTNAINAYANFPSAWLNYFEMHRAEFDAKGYPWIKENVLDKAIEFCPESVEVVYLAINVAMRYGEMVEAMTYIDKAQKMRPGVFQLYFMLYNCYIMMAEKNEERCVEFLQTARQTMEAAKHCGPQYVPECMDHIMHLNAKIYDEVNKIK